MTTITIDIQPQQKFSRPSDNQLKMSNVQYIVSELNKQAALGSRRVLVRLDDETSRYNANGKTVDPVRLSRYVASNAKYKLLNGLPELEEYDFTVHVNNAQLANAGACFADAQQQQTTGLIEWLKAQHTTMIVIGGLPVEECLQKTVLQLCEHTGWDVVVNLPACRGYAPESMFKAVCAMRRAGAKVINDVADMFNYSMNMPTAQSKLA